jgi:hypothetical protein
MNTKYECPSPPDLHDNEGPGYKTTEMNHKGRCRSGIQLKLYMPVGGGNPAYKYVNAGLEDV